jgi:hypothetical protein
VDAKAREGMLAPGDQAAAGEAARRSDGSSLGAARLAGPHAAADAAAAQKQNKKRRRDGRDRRIVPGADQPYVSPPEASDLQMLFTLPPNLVRTARATAMRACV